MEWPRAAIVVLNWNGWPDTIDCLESLQRLTYPNYQVILVDNGSTDDSVERIKAWAEGEVPGGFRPAVAPGPKPVAVAEYTREEAERGGLPTPEAALGAMDSPRRLVLIRNATNLGFGSGTNVGLRYAVERRYEYIGPLNNDTSAPPEYLSRLIGTLDRHGEFMAISPKILYADDPGRVFYAGGWASLWCSSVGYVGHQQRDREAWRGVHETTFISGCCFVGRRNLFESIGFFDEDFFFGYDEVAYSHVARRRGFAVGVDLDVVMFHKHGRSYGNREPFRVYHNTKNHVLMLRKYGSVFEQMAGLQIYSLVLAKLFFLWGVTGRFSLIAAALHGVYDCLRGEYGRLHRTQGRGRPAETGPSRSGAGARRSGSLPGTAAGQGRGAAPGDGDEGSDPRVNV